MIATFLDYIRFRPGWFPWLFMRYPELSSPIDGIDIYLVSICIPKSPSERAIYPCFRDVEF